MFNLSNKKPKLNVLPDMGISYVIENGEPLLTYFRPNTGLFCSTPLHENDKPYFLNIRRPIMMNVENVAPIEIPELPAECDGVILLNYGPKKIKAFFVRDILKQSISF